MTSEPRDAAAVRFPPPLIPLAAIGVGVALNWASPIDLGFTVSPAVRHWLGALMAVGAILLLGVWPAVLFRRVGQNVIPWTPTPNIETRGPYRITRNPMYLQMVLVCLGVAIYQMNWWLLLLTPVTGWLLRRIAIGPEEAYLERKFGETYLSYKRRTPRWL